MKQGLLLLNLGTPKSPEPEDVGEYLKEFLMDPFVIDIPFPLRWFLVHVLIVPKRKHASSELYKKVWTDRGSPLLFHTQDLLEKVRAGLQPASAVEMCMRYGEPSIEAGLEKLRVAGVSRLCVLPLYPQYSLAATESSIQRIKEVLRQMDWKPALFFVPPFFSEPAFLDVFAAQVTEQWKEGMFDKVLFSFHGLPERQVKRTDPSGKYCVCNEQCCFTLVEQNKNCYRAQSYETARQIAKRVGLEASQYLVAFQSRLGRTPWIKPHSDMYYETLPLEGTKKLLVVSPSFVADCLETVEEISLRGRAQFLERGGEKLELVPSLNAGDAWARTVVSFYEKALFH